MHSSAKMQTPPITVIFLCSCENVDHKQEACFVLCLICQIVTVMTKKP